MTTPAPQLDPPPEEILRRAEEERKPKPKAKRKRGDETKSTAGMKDVHKGRCTAKPPAEIDPDDDTPEPVGTLSTMVFEHWLAWERILGEPISNPTKCTSKSHKGWGGRRASSLERIERVWSPSRLSRGRDER